MYYHYWGRVRFSAQCRDLSIGVQATGWAKRYILASGMGLSLYTFVADNQRLFLRIQPGESADLDVVIHPHGDEELREGMSWRIQYTPDRVLGTCEMIELLARWRDDSDEPARMREPSGAFCGI